MTWLYTNIHVQVYTAYNDTAFLEIIQCVADHFVGNESAASSPENYCTNIHLNLVTNDLLNAV